MILDEALERCRRRLARAPGQRRRRPVEADARQQSPRMVVVDIGSDGLSTSLGSHGRLLQQYRGLDNILYFQSWYPVEGSGRKYAGGDIVDIVGMDGTLTDTPPGLWDSLRAFGKPIALSESWVPEGTTAGSFDTRTIIGGIKRLAPRITFFVQFDHPRYPKNHLAANLFARELLSDPWIVNAPIFDSLQRK
jgi:Glycosyl hydrolase family 26